MHSLTEEDKFKTIRPILGDHILDNDMPVMHKTSENEIDFENMMPMGIQNLCTMYDNSKKLILPFSYDKDLLKFWNDPLKYIPRLQSAMAVGTPDYSVYPEMNRIEIEHNVYQSRWLGCLWQTYGCKALPVISWWESDTYDICLRGVEEDSIVIVSTVGCSKNLDIFMNGFNEMKKRIKPSLIIVYGDMLDEMTGRFVNIRYKESFSKNKNINEEYKQISFLPISNIFERKDGV
jgi:hypothetical protein